MEKPPLRQDGTSSGTKGTPFSSASSLGSWISASDNPVMAHRAVLRLTYSIAPAVVAMGVLARLLGMAVPVGLGIVLGLLMVAIARGQDRMLQRGRFAAWMPALHLNVGLMSLTVWVAFSGGIQSPFVWVYTIAVAIYSILWGIRWGIATATLCTTYLILASVVAPHLHLVLGGTPPLLVPLHASLVSDIAMFFIVAFVSATLRQQTREIFHESQTDALTGLWNRRALRGILDTEMDRAVMSGTPCAIVEIEIDHFKRINDRFGHLEGDAALSRIAAVLRRTCRARDFLARYGGDEFVMVMPQTTLDEGSAVVERIRQAVGEDPHLQRLRLTVSLGVAVFPDHGQTARDLLEAADKAMYRVKRRGGNAVAVA